MTPGPCAYILSLVRWNSGGRAVHDFRRSTGRRVQNATRLRSRQAKVKAETLGDGENPA